MDSGTREESQPPRTVTPVTRTLEEIKKASALYRAGFGIAESARVLTIPRSTIMTWKRQGFLDREPPPRRAPASCEGACPHIDGLPGEEYAYLLGLYLGTGC